MTEEQRLNIQCEIIQFLANTYYYLNRDIAECNAMACSDSYKIMKIIKDVLAKEHGAAVQKGNSPSEHS